MKYRIPLLALVLTAPFLAVDVAWADPLYYSGGHADIGVRYVDQELAFRYDLGTSAIVNGAPLGSGVPDQFAPDEIIVQVGSSAYEAVGGSVASFFPSSTHGYFFGGENSSTKPYLGLSGMDPTIGVQDWLNPYPEQPFSNTFGYVTYEITGVNYTGNAIDPQVLYYNVSSSTGDVSVIYDLLGGVSNPENMFSVQHQHFIWGFSDPGTYEVAFNVSGNHVVDGYKEATGVFTFEVAPVPEPSSICLSLFGGVALVGGLVRRRFRAGK